MPVFVFVDDETCMCGGITLEQLLHAVLDGFDTVLVVFDDHDNLGSDTAGEGGVCHEHDWRRIDDDEVVVLFQFADHC